MSPESSLLDYMESLKERGLFNSEVVISQGEKRQKKGYKRRKHWRNNGRLPEAVAWVRSQPMRRGLLREASELFEVSYHALQKKLNPSKHARPRKLS